MSQLDYSFEKDKKGNAVVMDLTTKTPVLHGPSPYLPTKEEKETLMKVRKHFTLSDVIMKKPRREFNDLSVISRLQVDKMSFNSYQPNNGDATEGDETNSWKSRALRPIVRNKCISTAAHITAKLIFPKVFAYNENSQSEEDAAQVMEDLMEWAGDQSNYQYNNLEAVMTALWSPASIVHTEYCEYYRNIKKEKENGSWKVEKILDEDMSGFQDQVIPVDQFYISDFFQSNIQKQDWLIWRRVESYENLKSKYEDKYPNFKYIRPGVQVLYNDANQTFYEVYDSNMRQEMGEELLYYNKAKDLYLIVVNGVLLTDYDNPNPRNDKLYPFAKFGYELIDEGRCFYYKSLAFKTSQDANIINTLYPMIIDGTYLNLMPPMVATGSETIGGDVIIPGAITTFASPDADMKPIQTSNNLTAGLNVLKEVEGGLADSTLSPVMQGQFPDSRQTAYSMASVTQQAQMTLGLFTKMVSDMVKQYGRLRIGDILQYLTIAEVTDITDDAELVYKTFLMPGKQSGGREKVRNIKFDMELPNEPISAEEKMALSKETLQMEGGLNSAMELYRVNPELFRKLKFKLTVSPDILNPMSEELEKALGLELYDRAIQNPLVDQEAITKDFLLANNKKSSKDVNKYIKKQEVMPGAGTPEQMMEQMQNNTAANNPVNKAMNLQVKVPNNPASKLTNGSFGKI